jgi:hypothetical protein
MKDDFVKQLREEPRPEFADPLWQRPRAQNEGEPAPVRVGPSRWRPAFGGVAAAAAFTILLTFPSVRVAAQGFLDSFRVKRVAAVPMDFKRLDNLSESVDMKSFMGEQVETLVDPGRLERLDNVETATALTGLDVLLPKSLPKGYEGPDVRYRGEGMFRVTADMGKVESLLQSLGIEDVVVPWEANGAVFTVKAPPLVELVYKRGDQEIVFLQCASPEVDLPPGVDLRKLGELVLRMQGLSVRDARAFARKVDWTSTLVVPVPTMGSEYHEVDLGAGTKGLLVTMQHAGRLPSDRTRRATGLRRSALIWSSEGRLYSLGGPGNGTDLLHIAHAIR